MQFYAHGVVPTELGTVQLVIRTKTRTAFCENLYASIIGFETKVLKPQVLPPLILINFLKDFSHEPVKTRQIDR